MTIMNYCVGSNVKFHINCQNNTVIQQENIDKIVSYSEALYCSLNDTSDMVEKARVIALVSMCVHIILHCS